MNSDTYQGRLIYDENCDAYTHLLRDDSGIRIIASTQQSSRDEHEANARRLAACWNACRGISTEELVDIENTGGMLGPREDIARIAGQRNEMVEALSELLNEVDGLIGESTGVVGLHLNGDVAPWSELEEGGRFERLSSMSKARAVIASVTGEQP